MVSDVYMIGFLQILDSFGPALFSSLIGMKLGLYLWYI